MKLTLANIKELKRNSSSPLIKRICNYVINEWSDYSDKKSIFTDVLYHGCQSGIVGEYEKQLLSHYSISPRKRYFHYYGFFRTF